MAVPIYGDGPKITQEGATAFVYDHASWFDQDGTRATRWVDIWYWNGTNIWSIPAPPKRTEPDKVQPGEALISIPLGPQNIGGEFYVVEFGGIESGAFGSEPAWTEWGREWSGNREDQSKWGAKSNVITIKDWRPAAPTGDQLAAQHRDAASRELRLALDAWKAENVPFDKVAKTKVWRAYQVLVPNGTY